MQAPVVEAAPAAAVLRGVQAQDAETEGVVNIEERNKLVEKHLGVAKIAAKQLHKRYNEEYDDCLSAACIGLIDAAEQFDADKGARFTSFASKRVRGAIIDDIRSTSRIPRLGVERHRVVERARERFFKQHGRQPSEAELFKAAGMTAGDRKNQKPYLMGMVNRAEGTAKAPRNETFWDSLEPETPDAGIGRADWWRAACSGLRREEKTIMLLYFRDGLTLKETGRAIGISESGASQKVVALIKRLKTSTVLKRLAAAEVRDAA